MCPRRPFFDKRLGLGPAGPQSTIKERSVFFQVGKSGPARKEEGLGNVVFPLGPPRLPQGGEVACNGLIRRKKKASSRDSLANPTIRARDGRWNPIGGSTERLLPYRRI